ncbi:MAG: hypothetical protein J6D54_02880 [Olsenella sp.]|nr:hypothetical protein [Olsenella sp.]
MASTKKNQYETIELTDEKLEEVAGGIGIFDPRNVNVDSPFKNIPHQPVPEPMIPQPIIGSGPVASD